MLRQYELPVGRPRTGTAAADDGADQDDDRTDAGDGDRPGRPERGWKPGHAACGDQQHDERGEDREKSAE